MVCTHARHIEQLGVTYQTARNDLLDLEALGYLDRRLMSREFRFYPEPNLADPTVDRVDDSAPSTSPTPSPKRLLLGSAFI